MTVGIEVYQLKPQRTNDKTFAVRYRDSASVTSLLEIAQMQDSNAVIHEFPFATETIAVVVTFNSERSDIDSHVIRPGRYLAYSEANDFIYVSDESNFTQFYDRVSIETS